MRVFIAHFQTDFAASLAGAAKQFFCFVHPVVGQVFNESLTGLLAENHAQMIWREIHIGSQKI